LINYLDKKIKELQGNEFYGRISLAFIIQVVGLGLGFISNIVLAKVLGAGGYGLFALSLNWMLMFSLFSRLGFETTILKFIPIYDSTNDWSKIKGLIKSSSITVFLSSVIIYLVVGMILVYFMDLPEEKTYYYLKFFLVLPFYSLIALFSSLFRAFKLVILSLSSFIVLSSSFAIILAIFYMLSKQGNMEAVVPILYLSTAMSVFLIFCFLFFSKFKTDLRKKKSQFQYKTWMLVSLPLLLIESMSFFLGQTDILMLGALSTDESVGYYQAAIKISSITGFGLGAVNFILAPEISRLYHSKKLKELQDKITQSSKLLFVFAFSASVVLMALGNFILSTFGEDFKTAYISTVILIVGQFVNVLTGAVGFLMSLTGHQNIALKVILISVIINVILNYLLIPIYDIKGAAISTAITTILRNVWLAILVRKILKLKPTIIY